MAVKIVTGCLLDAFDKGVVDVIGHVVNCQGKMNSGIAKSIRERYPKVYEQYMELSGKFTPKELLSTAQFVEFGYPFDKEVWNLFAQLNYGYDGKKYLDDKALDNCLWVMSEQLYLEGNSVVGFPFKMGSDRAGGDWNYVLDRIEFYFKDHNVRIYKLEV